MQAARYSGGMAHPARLLAAALGLVACAAGAAETGLVMIDWSADGRFARELEIAPQRFAEVCGPLPAGQAVRWRYAGSTPLDFNIHYHEGDSVRTPAQHRARTRAAGTLRVRATQDYCWMWSNRSAQPARLSLELRRTPGR